jgi:MATE family multidrug resistance protein
VAESELLRTVRLAGPIVLAELGWIAMGNVDIMMVGRAGGEAIAAVSLGTTVFYTVAICASSVLLGMDTLVSHASGAKDLDRGRRTLVQGVWVSLLLIPIVMGIVASFEMFLAKFGVDTLVLRGARPYLRVLNWSAPPLLIYFCLRRYLQAIDVVRPVMWILLTANLVNLAGNWILVFGRFGFPAMGAVGSAWSTCLSRVYMAAGLGIVLWRRDPGIFVPSQQWRANLGGIRELCRLGLPAAGQIGVEYGVFTVVTVLVGRLGAMSLASHQLALSTVYTTYMLPLGLSSAAAVRVGQALGRGDPAGAARAGWTAVGLGAAIMSAAAVTLLTAPRWIARLFTPQLEVIAAAATLLRIAAFFQLFDGLQVVTTGALRGAGDTRTPMLCHFAGYWLIGLPLGVWLCFTKDWGAPGLWTGLSVGLILIGSVLTMQWRRAAYLFQTRLQTRQPGSSMLK